MSKNRAMTKAMAALESQLNSSGNTAFITRDEFKAVSDHIETLEHDIQMLACDYHSLLSQLIQPEHYQVDSEETVYIPDQYEQARQANRMQWEHLNDLRKHKLVLK